MPKLNKNKNNDYLKKPKENCIETPEGICQCLFDNLKNKIDKNTTIIDIGCANGNLSRRFFNDGYNVVGIDIKNYSNTFKGNFLHKNFFKIEFCPEREILILCNPVWNNPKKTANLSRDQWEEVITINFAIKEKGFMHLRDKRIILLDTLIELGIDEEEIYKLIGVKYKYNNMAYFPEMFMRHIFEVYGIECKVVLLTIYGFLMNNGINSKRYKWLRDENINITSVLEIPKNIFKGVDIWNHILFFNISGLRPVWFLDEKYIKEN